MTSYVGRIRLRRQLRKPRTQNLLDPPPRPLKTNRSVCGDRGTLLRVEIGLRTHFCSPLHDSFFNSQSLGFLPSVICSPNSPPLRPRKELHRSLPSSGRKALDFDGRLQQSSLESQISNKKESNKRNQTKRNQTINQSNNNQTISQTNKKDTQSKTPFLLFVSTNTPNAQLPPSPRRVGVENRDILIDLPSLLLHDALADPHQISNLLQLEMAVAVIRRYLSPSPPRLPRWNWLSNPASSNRTSFR